ncbi:Type 1 glutamine amidotransferase-like domain-containing protein [Radiobacillus deserti]|uniref:Type 1 glutamine amidotransferase-like domain-containing protein n=1 Tax=Radiobacillus deserti TaxID=2594883 RepID=UPI0013155EC8|nr:Type 1 glutamine amidotransferase-like domain-containing protein [Radiobacillus deserti]
MSDRYLYMLGGKLEQPEAMKAFLQRAGGQKASIALLIIYREGWEDYLPNYTKYWDLELSQIYTIVLNPNTLSNVKEILDTIDQATGVFIGGGHTKTYYDCYVKSPIKDAIIQKYREGTPIGGNSAGALIMPDKVLLSPHDTDDELPWIGDGLGLCPNVAISVHFSQWNDQEHLIKGIERLQVPIGYGIDEKACLVFKNEKPHHQYEVSDHTVHTFYR